MKTATMPSLRVEPALREAAEGVLTEGETLSGFIEQAVREAIARRNAQREFVARGLASRDTARRTGQYREPEAVLGRLESMLEAAREAKRSRS